MTQNIDEIDPNWLKWRWDLSKDWDTFYASINNSPFALSKFMQTAKSNVMPMDMKKKAEKILKEYER